MKKIVSLMLLALSITLVNAQKSEETIRLEKLNLKHIESVFDEKAGEIDKETKALRVNRLEHFKADTEDANAIALSYLRVKRDLYGINSGLYDIKIAKIMESPSGKYIYCRQYVNGIPVFATNFTVYINKENTVKYARNEFRNIDKYKGKVKSASSINDGNALKIAKEYLNIKGVVIGEPKTELIYFESVDKGLELAWKINIISMEPMGDWQMFISASDGSVIHVEDIRISATGSGKVFRPNPLVSANVPYGYNNNYMHNNGASNPQLEAQQMTVTLNDITYENGVYKLRGPYAVVEDIEPPYGHTIPESSTPTFNFQRNQNSFKALMCYYYVDLSARRILQLGYGIPNGLKNFRADPVGVHGQRNAYYMPGDNYIAFGAPSGYVPAAEDADVILHEYGHAIQWNFGAGNMQSGIFGVLSVLEGSSDYWATSYKRSLHPNNWAEIGLWFEMDIPLASRRTDVNWVYPTDYIEGYHGSQIWSSALMKIWGDLGRDVTDKLFLEAHLIWGQAPFMRDAATAFMQADLHLYNGSNLCQIYSRFQQHGLIDTSQIIQTINFSNQTVSTNKIVFSCTNLNVQNTTVTPTGSLNLRAPGNITITAPFNVNSGATLSIQNQ